jgi:hypothetical protein
LHVNYYTSKYGRKENLSRKFSSSTTGAAPRCQEKEESEPERKKEHEGRGGSVLP